MFGNRGLRTKGWFGQEKKIVTESKDSFVKKPRNLYSPAQYYYEIQSEKGERDGDGPVVRRGKESAYKILVVKHQNERQLL